MSNNTMEKRTLSVRDLVNIGIFTAVYFVLFFISASTGMIPIMAVFFPVLSAVLSGIPMILFFTKVNKFGMITVLCVLSGVINFGMGFGPQSIVFALICGLLADLILKAGKYKSWKHVLLAYIIFSEWVIGTMLPMWIMKDTYFETARSSEGDAFADTTLALITNWMLVVVIIAIAVGALAGAYWGRAVLKKHFRRAGIV